VRVVLFIRSLQGYLKKKLKKEELNPEDEFFLKGRWGGHGGGGM
jgi:hypothetical protein